MRDFSSRIALVVAFLVIFGFGGWFHHSALALDLPKRLPGKKYHPQMESVLAMLREKYIEGRAVAETFSRKRQIPFHDDEVTVVLVPPEDEDPSVIDEADLRSWGAKVEAVSRHLLRASVPVSNLDKIADKVAGISYIRLPLTPLPAEVRSEGVELINALAYHNSGYLGQNTKVAIIDLGFERLAAAQADGDIPYTIISKDFTGEGLSTGTTHGTDMTEIVHDVAPEAQLYLIKIADEVDLENAKDYCVSEGVDIINHSWGWFNTNFTDGTGLVCSIADDARSSGILWVNAAGNWAEKHYQGLFADSDNNNWHNFTPGDQTNIIQTSSGDDIYIYLTWDDWPTTSQDYDLYLFVLFGSDLVPIADSTNRQTGTQPPIESIVIPNAWSNTYYVAIRRESGTEDKELKIFSFSHSLQYQTVAHSLSAPADAKGVVAVAAIDQANWYTGPQEDYTSQGPTTDGRTKPDISGPTNISTFTSGRQGGTSAATPHVAGAASLLLSRYPDWTSGQLQSILESWAVDMGRQGKDNIYGAGRLNLILSPDQPPNVPPAPSGPDTGKPGFYTFTATTTDPDGDQVAFKFNWGDGTESSWSSFVDSGGLVNGSHSWSSEGTYEVKVKAKDIYGAQSGWSDAHIIVISMEAPILEVDPVSLAFAEVKVPQTKTMTFRVYNSGTGTLSGTISDDRDWITVDPTSFEGNDNTISVMVDTGVMDAELWKEYTGTVVITSNGGTKDVNVSVTPTCVKAYPIPFNPWHSQLTFWGSGVPYAKIKIYTVSGELVKTIYETDGNDKVYWDGRNEEGNLVVTGIYLFLATNPKEKSVGRFMVIKKP